MHPDIPLSRPDLEVAEVGTGTGIWLLEVAKQLPSTAKFTGFDISADQFPHEAWLPGNVTFSVADASKPPASEFQGKFDVVHLRLFSLVVENNDPTPFIDHCLSLLRPGGYLQWDEYDLNSTGVVRAEQQAGMKHVSSMLRGIAMHKTRMDLADTFLSAGP